MLTPSIRSKGHGLGLDGFRFNGNYLSGHSGGGGGFASSMYWLGEYGIGAVSMINSEDCAHSLDMFSDLIKEGLVQKNESFEIPSAEYSPWQPPDPNAFTRFKPEWKKNVGAYGYVMSGCKPGIALRIAVAFGLKTSKTHVKVFEEDGYLCVDSHVYHDDDGGRLDEYLPGLFFTPSGKCLDLRGPVLRWQNWKIKRVDSDPDRKFGLGF